LNGATLLGAANDFQLSNPKSAKNQILLVLIALPFLAGGRKDA
jgi:hypothetical protein